MCTSSRKYIDILNPRREEYSNFLWVSRNLNCILAWKQDPKPTPQLHKEQVLSSRRIQELLDKLSREQIIPKKILENQVKLILDEISYKKSLKLIRWLALVLVKLCKKILSGIFINEIDILNIKNNMGDCPVIFMPSHRSYADFILMSFVLFSQDITIPAIAAGIDFNEMWGMGTMLRNTGAFFMRRSYNSDSLYWATFKQYIYQIVSKGDLPIEFFIEGTRSRSGKSLTPKYGVLIMILKAFFLAQVPDIMIVPINISYDRLLEERLFAFELLGIPKPRESTSGFFKSLSVLREKYGNFYCDFAQPISVKSFFGDKLDRSVHVLKPTYQQELTDYEKTLLPPLAHEVIYRQQKHCVITTFNLIALMLNNNIINRNESDFDYFIKDVTWLKEILEVYGAFIDFKDIGTSLDIHQNLVELKNNKVNLIWNNIVLGNFNSLTLKGHNLKEKTINYSMPLVMLQIYINPVLHYLVDSAILVIILKCCSSLSEDELFRHYDFLRSLLSLEFVIFHQRSKMEFNNAMDRSIKLNLLKECNERFYELGQNKKLEDLLSSLMDCFLYTYYMVCCVLVQCISKVCDEKAIIAKVQEEIENKINVDEHFIHPYCLSLDTISNCLNNLCTLNILNKITQDGIVMYEVDENQIYNFQNKFHTFLPPSYSIKGQITSIIVQLKNKL